MTKSDVDAAATAHRLRLMVAQLRRRMSAASATDGLSAPQAMALFRLSQNPGLTASELAAAERVQRQSMAVIVQELKAAGLIRKEPDPDDGRRRLLYPTVESREQAQGSRDSRGEWLRQHLADDFSATELATIDTALHLLERIVGESA